MTTTKKNRTKRSYIRHTVQDKNRTWIILLITMILCCLILCCLCLLLMYDPCLRWSFVVNWPVDASIIIIIRMIIRRSLVVIILVIPGIVILIILIRDVVVCGRNNIVSEGRTQQRVRMPPHHPQSETHNQPIQAQGGPHPPTGSFCPHLTNACGSSPSFTSRTSSIHRREAGVCFILYS